MALGYGWQNRTIRCSIYSRCALADPSGRQERAPPGPMSFIFMQCLGKNWQNSRLALPPWELVPPIWENLDPKLICLMKLILNIFFIIKRNLNTPTDLIESFTELTKLIGIKKVFHIGNNFRIYFIVGYQVYFKRMTLSLQICAISFFLVHWQYFTQESGCAKLRRKVVVQKSNKMRMFSKCMFNHDQ